MYDTTMFYITGPQEGLKIQGGNQSKGKLTLHCHHVSTNHRTKLIQDCNWLKKSCSNSRSFKREGFVKNWLEENGPLPLFPTALHIKILHKGSKCSLTSVKHAKIQIFNRLSFYVFSVLLQGPFNNYGDKMRGGGVKKCLFLSTLRV